MTEHEAGPALDALIARSLGLVYGARPCETGGYWWSWWNAAGEPLNGDAWSKHGGDGGDEPEDGDTPKYSTDIAEAMGVAETWRHNWSLIRMMGLSGNEETVGDGEYRLILSAPGLSMAGYEAETAALCICRAQLALAGLREPVL